MLKQVTVTDLQRNAAKVISEIDGDPVVISQRGRPAAILMDPKTFELIERRLEETEAKEVLEVIEAGLASYRAGRLIPHAEVARSVRKRRDRRR